ncbi:MAG: hypothetical protein ABFC67_10185 [Mizugakiibacter sp.]|uniref:hypothetical protein n=1 Tax=Mizugakiibacter sp. TaxID=1972610 RepID=UPI0031C484B9|nr:hypothetical protein [Xanthomonadaceae bacterium]
MLLYPAAFVVLCALSVRDVIAEEQTTSETEVADKGAQDDGGSRFLFVPYPVTEPAIGNGLLAGPVWMRAGPHTGAGPSLPQAYGFGGLWTDGGSRGVLAFDERAWGSDGRWQTTAIAARADLKLKFSGLSPAGDASIGFNLHAAGGSIEVERKLGDGPNSVAIDLFSVSTRADFPGGLPPELAREQTKEEIAGARLTWSQDTRDEVFAPSSGHYASASLDSGLSLKWMGYGPGLGGGVLGLRAQFDVSLEHEAFYLRPYISLRGVPALRYAGEQVGEVEAEYRFPLDSRWDIVAFGGLGAARADLHGITGQRTVSTEGLGVRFKVQKLFGLTFGVDVARGPDGTFVYIQIGNPWSK